jgi:hypothetical protein
VYPVTKQRVLSEVTASKVIIGAVTTSMENIYSLVPVTHGAIRVAGYVIPMAELILQAITISKQSE